MTAPSDVETTVPLCVDMDGTLVRTDLIVESLLRLLKRNPLYLIRAAGWLLQGKARLKAEIAKRTTVAADTLPYNDDVIEFIRRQRRPVHLVTGSDRSVADAVADHVGLFDEVIASDGQRNLTRENKRDELIRRFGEGGFDYIGNDTADWPVWAAARKSLVTAREGRFLTATKKRVAVDKVFALPRVGFRNFIKAIRVHQWIKNTLMFVPFLLNHRFDDFAAMATLALGFAAMCLLASFTYIVNDLLDLDADRRNPTKKLRAFASGLMSLREAFVTMFLLLLATVLLAAWLDPLFQLVLVAYFVSTIGYSLYFKRLAILDVCILASLYTLRVIGGIVVIGAEWSFWLLAFSMFFFVSLALAKRVSELENIRKSEQSSAAGRGYLVADLPVLIAAGVSSGMLSILVVALYINADKVLRMYALPQILWLICPLLLYWIGRVWIITVRGHMHQDPILFAIRDRVSLLTAVLAAIVLASAIVVPGLTG